MKASVSPISPIFSRDLSAVSDRELVAIAVDGFDGSFEELRRSHDEFVVEFLKRDA